MGDNNVPPAIIEDSGIEQFVFAFETIALRVFLAQFGVGELHPRVGIRGASVGMGWGRIEVPPLLFHIFCVVAFISVQTKEAFLEVRVSTVPQRKPQAPTLMPIADAKQAIFVPSIRST